jgi:DNA-binding response OmpR family regulator
METLIEECRMVFENQKLKILVVARNDALRNSLRALLCAVFPSGELDQVESEAAAVVAFQEKKFHLVILYPGLPVDVLLSTARQARQMAPSSRTLLIAEDQTQMRAGLEAGVDQAILSGFTVDELTSALKKMIPRVAEGA